MGNNLTTRTLPHFRTPAQCSKMAALSAEFFWYEILDIFEEILCYEHTKWWIPRYSGIDLLQKLVFCLSKLFVPAPSCPNSNLYINDHIYIRVMKWARIWPSTTSRSPAQGGKMAALSADFFNVKFLIFLKRFCVMNIQNGLCLNIQILTYYKN